MEANRYNTRKVIVKRRGEGKTELLLRESARTGGTMLCSSLHVARHLKKRAIALDLQIPEPLSYRQFMSWREHPGMHEEITHLLMDEVDLFASWLSPVEISAVSITPSAEEGEE